MNRHDLPARNFQAHSAIALIAVALVFSGCERKDPVTFEPLLGDVSRLPDNQPPLASFVYPVPGIDKPFNIDVVRLLFQDPDGANGRPASGIDQTAASVRFGTNVLSGSWSDAEYTANLGSLADGQYTVTGSGRDNAGNAVTITRDLLLLRGAPTIALNEFPSSLTTYDDMFNVPFGGTIAGQYIGLATGAVYRGDCATGTPWPEGGPGGVVRNSWTYNVGSDGGSFTGMLRFNKPESQTQAPVTTTGCLKVYAENTAVDGVGDAKPGIGLAEVAFVIEHLFARTGTVSGTVTMAGTGEPVPGVTVSAGDLSDITDSGTGSYEIDMIPEGSATVAITAGVPAGVTCLPAAQTVDVVAGQTTQNVNFTCQTQPTGLTVTPTALTKTHAVGGSPCPDLIGSVVMHNPTAGVLEYVVVGGPEAIQYLLVGGGATGTVPAGGTRTIAIGFNCATTTSFSAWIEVVGKKNGEEVSRTRVNVTVTIQ